MNIEHDCRSDLPVGAIDTHVLMRTIRAGATYALRRGSKPDRDDALGVALLRIVERWSDLTAPTSEAAYAAACGRNAALDLIRVEGARQTALMRLTAQVDNALSPTAPALDLPFGWAWQEIPAQARLALALARAELRCSPSAQLRAAVEALETLLAGQPLPSPADDTARRRLDRGIDHLARLLK